MDILHGIRVLDFTQYQAGPYGTALLADFGADVIKIERPGGEPGRTNQPSFDGVSAFFLANNRGKRGVCIDLAHAGAADVLQRLILGADALVHNLKPGAMEKLGLGYDDVRGINPRIVYAAVSTYGPKGRKRDQTGVDLIAQAESGLMSVTGMAEGPAIPVGVAIADALAGVNVAFGVIAALLARERGGSGQAVHVSLVGGLLGLQAWELQHHLMSRVASPKGGGSHPLLKTIWQSFRATDGEFVIAEVKDSWPGICKAIDRPDLAKEERFRSVGRRFKNRAELVGILEEAFRGRSVEHWVSRLREHDILAAPVRSYTDIAADPDTRADGYIRMLDHPDKGPIEVSGPFLNFSETPPSIRSAAPRLGQHTNEVLAELGLAAEEIERLRAEGVIA
jgi:crotonobetainyl-CoA:carnitine CoA-transferase CaiB-like acyl-CoA transferase